jgi:hypothetical protein
MTELKTSRVTSSKLEHPKIFPQYTYQDEGNLLSLSFSDNDLKKIKESEDSVLVCNYWYKAVDKIYEFGNVKNLFKEQKKVSIKLPNNVGDITFCIFSYDKKNGKKLTSSNLCIQEFEEDGQNRIDTKQERHPWKLLVNQDLHEPWRLMFDSTREEYIIEITSLEMLEAIKKHNGNNGYNISVQISFLKAILQRSLHEYIYRQDEFESSNIFGLFRKIIDTLGSSEDPCPIDDLTSEDRNEKYDECLEWIDNVCEKYFITKNDQNLFRVFLELVSYGEVEDV